MNICVDVLPVRREHLHAAVRPVGHVDQPVVRDLDGVHRPAELLRAGALGIERRRGATAAAGVRAAARARSSRRGRHIDGRVAERAPHPLERAGVGVEHDDAAVAVAVGDERLVGLRPHEDVGRLVDGLRVGVALADASGRRSAAGTSPCCRTSAACRRRDCAATVRRRGAAADPDVVLVVDGDAVLAVRPVVARARVRPTRSRISPSASNSSTGGAACSRCASGIVFGRCSTQT